MGVRIRTWTGLDAIMPTRCCHLLRRASWPSSSWLRRRASSQVTNFDLKVSQTRTMSTPGASIV